MGHDRVWCADRYPQRHDDACGLAAFCGGPHASRWAVRVSGVREKKRAKVVSPHRTSGAQPRRPGVWTPCTRRPRIPRPAWRDHPPVGRRDRPVALCPAPGRLVASGDALSAAPPSLDPEADEPGRSVSTAGLAAVSRPGTASRMGSCAPCWAPCKTGPPRSAIKSCPLLMPTHGGTIGINAWRPSALRARQSSSSSIAVASIVPTKWLRP